MNEMVTQAIDAIRKVTPKAPRIGAVLGSGLGVLIEEFEEAVSIPYPEIPNFPVSAVVGHSGKMVFGTLAGNPMVALSGRVHYYEGHTMQTVAFPIEVLAALGVETLLITNASGAINQSFSPGELVAIRDHINLMGDNPLRGSSRFIDLTDAYAANLRDLAHQTADELNITLHNGVYVGVGGPCYETPAEIKSMRHMGGDLVGMSTVPEVIMANSLGIKVLGISMVTNMAAGITGAPLSHQEVIDTSRKAQESFKKLVRSIVEKMM